MPVLWVPFAAVLLAFGYPFGLGFRQAPPPATARSQVAAKHTHSVSSAQTHNNSETALQKAQAPKHDVRKLLSEFYGVRDYKRIEEDPSGIHHHPYRLKFVIATLPDPL